MKFGSDLFLALVVTHHQSWIVKERDTLAELESEKERMSDLVPDVRRREIVDQTIDVSRDLLLIGCMLRILQQLFGSLSLLWCSQEVNLRRPYEQVLIY